MDGVKECKSRKVAVIDHESKDLTHSPLGVTVTVVSEALGKRVVVYFQFGYL